MTMKKTILIIALGAAMGATAGNPQWLTTAQHDDLRAELAATPEKSGGAYFAYPITEDEAIEAPAGFQPVFLTHYGRHGSRWCIRDYQYTLADSVFALNARIGNLTPLGKDVQQRLLRISAHAQGHAGELSPLGERQHKAIAGRMAARFPRLFADSNRVEARSSQVQRCIISMAAFTERLKEVNPQLRVQRHATPSDMDFIAYDSPEALAISKGNAPWRSMQKHMRDSLIQPGRLMASLFVNPTLAIDTVAANMEHLYAPKNKKGAQPRADKPAMPRGDAERLLTKVLHDIAIDLQDVDGLEDMTLFDIFTEDELYNLWQMLNLEMYVRHSSAPQGNYAGANSARGTVKRLLDVADAAIAECDSLQKAGVENPLPAVTAQLHFGHDTNLIRLTTLMGIVGCAPREADPTRFDRAWQDFRVAPMAGNLQLVFFRNKAGRTLMAVRHNEQNTALPIPYAKEGAPFYEWTTAREYLMKQLD